MSENWQETDKSIYLVHNWTDIREAIDVHIKHGGGSWELLENNTVPATDGRWANYFLNNGMHTIFNETEIRETHLILNG